jgi:nicotinate phosphoribosyltransferase
MEWIMLHHPTDHVKYRMLRREDVSEVEPLLVDVLREGQLVCELPSVEEMRARRKADLERLDPGVRRILNPHGYHVSLTQRLWDLKEELIQEAKEGRPHQS